MQDWTSGYVADVGYTYGYYNDLNPLRLRLAFLGAGLAFPDVGAACELGFGQGLSVAIHAAAAPIPWHGNDFNPSQAGFARELARASGSGAELTDQAFDEFCARDDLPEFDFIALHGIWSWISDANRAVIVEFLRRKLRVGGVVYVSYNTQPGWAAMIPMRDLLTEHAEQLGAPGRGTVAAIDGALAFAERLLAVDPAYARANPQIAARIRKLRDDERSYLAHEYFNRDWQPMAFSRIARELGAAKLEHACSAHYLGQLDAIDLTDAQQELLAGLPVGPLRETVRDFMVNRQFRRDYWVKGARRLTALEQAERLREQRVVLVRPRGDVSLKVVGVLGEAVLDGPACAPLLDILADHRPRSLGQLEASLRERGVGFADLVQGALVLAGVGALAPAQDDASVARARPRTAALNRLLLNKSRGSHEFRHLASPVTGGGVPVARNHQLFLHARARAHADPRAWAEDTWSLLQLHDQRLILDGRTLETAEDNLAELHAQARRFAAAELPILDALEVTA